jgi:large subunit ribosomal protein L31
MKTGIHPEYVESTVLCACGNTFQTRSTKPSIRLEICSSCHPFFTGRQKFVDTAGRVERFQKRFAKTGGETVKKKISASMAKGQKPSLTKKKMKILSSAPIVIPKKAGSDDRRGRPSAGAKPADKPASTKTH